MPPHKAGNSWLIDTQQRLEVRAVKRLLTSHFICQTFISLFMVQCTPSAQARMHTCAWSTFKAFLPTFHDLMDKRKMADFRTDEQFHELFADNKRGVNIHVSAAHLKVE